MIMNSTDHMMEIEKHGMLYVDDEEVNQFLFKENFESTYPVFTAISGVEALQELESHDEITCVISDMHMPEMNGIEFITKATERFRKCRNIAFFVVTGYVYNEELDEAVDKKLIQNWFSKPFNMREIEEAIREHQRKTTQFGESDDGFEQHNLM